MSNKLVIIGAGGHAKVCIDIAIKMNIWSEITVLDDNEVGSNILGYDVVGVFSDYINYIDTHEYVVSVGDNRTRQSMISQIEESKGSFATLIHPQSTLGVDVNIGYATVIMAGVVINCSSTVGKGCIINTSSSLDHDTKVGDFVHVSPGVHIAGNVQIGDMAWLGVGSTVSNNAIVQTGSVVGAHSLVLKNVDADDIVIGSPVRSIKDNE